MKKRNLLLSGLLALTLAGCTDATAELSDAKTALVTIGNTSITKGQVYSLMNSASGAATAVNNANKVIASQEIEVTDDMKTTAQNTLNSYKSLYGDTFTTYLTNQGMSEEDYINDYLIPSQQAEKLVNKYIEENFDSLCSTYHVVKATVLEFSSQDDANAALTDLNNGTSASEAAKNHNSSSTGTSTVYTVESTNLNSSVRTLITGDTTDKNWVLVAEDDGSTYALVKIDDNDANNFKDEATTALASINNVSTGATTYFFKKYNFVIYDKTVYDGVAANYPDNLVQNIED